MRKPSRAWTTRRRRCAAHVLTAFVRPVGGTLGAARQFERLLTSVRGEEPDAIEPLLKELRVPTLLIWGTGDPNFGVEWAYRFRDPTCAGTGRSDHHRRRGQDPALQWSG